MAVQYELFEIPAAGRKDGEQLLHPRFIPSGRTDRKMLCEKMAAGTTFNSGELAGMLQRLEDVVLEELGSGNIVELGGLGTLSLALKSPSVSERSEIRAASVEVSALKLRTSKRMKARMGTFRIERKPDSWQSSPLDEAGRDRMLAAFFAAHPFMSSREYQQMRHCKYGMAIRELNRLVEEGKLERRGARGSSVYLPAGTAFRQEAE